MSQYKRFLVLMDEKYYPSQGMYSVVGSFDTYEEAMALALTDGDSHGIDFYANFIQIFDCDQRIVVWEK